jgi:hypothetical protein
LLGVEEVKEIKMGKKTELRGPGWVFILFGTEGEEMATLYTFLEHAHTS